MDDPETMWDSLALSSLVPLNPHSPSHSPASSPRHSPRGVASPSRFPDTPWWIARPDSPAIQVRLDGEVADVSDLSSPAALDILLPQAVASGRIEKPIPARCNRPPPRQIALPKQSMVVHPTPSAHRLSPVSNSTASPIKREPQVVQPPPPPPPPHSASSSSPSLITNPSTSLVSSARLLSYPAPNIHPTTPTIAAVSSAASSAAIEAASLPVKHSAVVTNISASNPIVSRPSPVFAAPDPSSLKEKRQREASQFPKEALANLDGTTSAEVRKMNAVERELVLYKRKLRNRESARRSRQKRQATLAELQDEIDDLLTVSARVVDVSLVLRQENDSLRNRLTCVSAELKGLRAFSAKGAPPPGPSSAPPQAALNMKLGG